MVYTLTQRPHVQQLIRRAGRQAISETLTGPAVE